MIFFKELNLPNVPEEYLNCLNFDDPTLIDTFIDADPVNYGQEYKTDNQVLKVCRYRFGNILYTPLLDWLKQNISPYVTNNASVLESSHGIFPMHIDKRKYALNYLIDTGGDNVITSWHQEHGKPIFRTGKVRGKQVGDDNLIWTHNTDLLDSVKIEKHKWYLIRTNVLHSVSHIFGTRKGISIDFNPMVDNDELLF